MTYARHIDMRPSESGAAALLPPAAVDEAAWDILLGLHLDRVGPSLAKLAAIASLPLAKLTQWLAKLEAHGLVTGVSNEVTREVRAMLTDEGHALLDHYLSAASGLQAGARH